VYTKSDQPREWAREQNNLGTVLQDEGERLPPEKAAPVLEQAVQALRNALEVYTQAAIPQAWATTENNLGMALSDQAKIAGDDKAIDLYDQAAVAYQNSLKVYTKADLPQDWARSEENMGGAMCDAALRVPPNDAGDAKTLLGLCVQGHQNALQVYTKANMPEVWARVQNSLGVALDGEAWRSAPDQAAALYEQAAQAYRAALEFYTKAGRPLNWARSQNNVGLALWHESQFATGDKATAMLEQSAQALRNALEVWNRTATASDWANAQFNLGYDLWLESQGVSGDKATGLLDESEQAYQESLKVYIKAIFPQDRSTTDGSLGLVHGAQGRYSVALADDEEALQLSPKNFVAALRVAEANLTLEHYDVCVKQAAAVDDAQLAGPTAAYLPVRETLKLACQWGAGDKGTALQTEKLLSGKVSQAVKGWNVADMLRFASASPAFASGRASWIALFTDLQNGDGAGMAAALHQLEPLMQN
jgi:tetratricopeptide (TPR) repeat protein